MQHTRFKFNFTLHTKYPYDTPNVYLEVLLIVTKTLANLVQKSQLNDLRCSNFLYMCAVVCTALTHDLHVGLFVLTPVI